MASWQALVQCIGSTVEFREASVVLMDESCVAFEALVKISARTEIPVADLNRIISNVVSPCFDWS